MPIQVFPCCRTHLYRWMPESCAADEWFHCMGKPAGVCAESHCVSQTWGSQINALETSRTCSSMFEVHNATLESGWGIRTGMIGSSHFIVQLRASPPEKLGLHGRSPDTPDAGERRSSSIRALKSRRTRVIMLNIPHSGKNCINRTR